MFNKLQDATSNYVKLYELHELIRAYIKNVRNFKNSLFYVSIIYYNKFIFLILKNLKLTTNIYRYFFKL
jgi:hypothetical protein